MTRSWVVGLAVFAAGLVPAGRIAADDPPAGEKPEVTATRLAKELDAARKQIEQLKKKNQELTDKLVENLAERFKAERAAQKANLKVEATKQKLARLLAELKNEKPDPFALDRPFLQLDEPLPAIPEIFDGTVTTYKDGLVRMSIGVDAGLAVGTVLDLYRDNGKYLGTVVVEKVYPKEAVAQFKPLSQRPLAKQKPDELPRVGDTVSGISWKPRP